jgi:hypothetical protein
MLLKGNALKKVKLHKFSVYRFSKTLLKLIFKKKYLWVTLIAQRVMNVGSTKVTSVAQRMSSVPQRVRSLPSSED